MPSKKLIIITGGGTGGHVFPALAIADELKRRNFDIHYVGSKRGMESTLVPDKGYPFSTVKTGAVKNQGAIKLCFAFINLLQGVLWSFRFLSKKKPVAVVGVGGYVSVPISVAAFFSGIPLYLQEQNSSVGLANRFLGRLARKIFLGFEEARPFFSSKKCAFTGNPLRPEFQSVKTSYDPQSNFLLVMGGSQGAKAINDSIVSLLPKLRENFPKLKILHQTGKKDYEEVKEKTKAYHEWYEPMAFIASPIQAYEKAMAVVCRSGALTVSELLQCRRPALFVPYPRRGQNDQTTNAYMLEKKGVARVVEQGENFPKRFEEALFSFLSPLSLESMGKAYAQLHIPNALASIGGLIETDLMGPEI